MLDPIRQKVVDKEQQDLLYVCKVLYRELIEDVGQAELDSCEFERQMYLALKYKDFTGFKEMVSPDIIPSVVKKLKELEYNSILTYFNFYFNL